ncbi:hypothetical protein I316_06821 [Kwoniella heveanensis BCC8398]|uniref:Glucose-6-phosphate 1-epimerase n=1 Tax=Kwoniella heveanensis BCC8398 TaxID=1296120 RepID=A0A1B9GK42_9TREE|nr:hypothetical protein I316_06821 [Kwoniella heveanensis BCC8398]
MPVQRDQKTVTISLPSGARATIHLFGAHVTSWLTPDGKERLYLSSKSTLEGPFAPNVFGGPTPDEVSAEPVLEANQAIAKEGHAFVRTRVWELIDTSETSDQVSVIFALDPSTYPEPYPKAIRLTYVVTLTPESLTTSLKAQNPSNSGVAAGMKLFYHNYMKVSDGQKVQVKGLKEGTKFKDTQKGGEVGSWEGGSIGMGEKLGKIFSNAVTPDGFVTDDGSDSIRVTSSSLRDCFMWNPQDNCGKSAWADMEPGDGNKFAGVHPGALDKWTILSPGEEFVGDQTLTLVH